MVIGPFKMRPTTWYPRPHESIMAWGAGAEEATARFDTICPILMYDEGQGDPASYNAHKEHASFTATDVPMCYPDSRVDKVFCQVEMWLAKGALETDKVSAMKAYFMPMFTSFKEDIEAKDEVSGLTIGTILELQNESTDRQSYPLYNNVDMSVTYTGANILGTGVPGPTGSQAIEGTAFDIDTYYDALQYYSNGAKLKTLTGGMNWVTLTKHAYYKKFNITLRSKSKFINPYTQFSIRLGVAQVDTDYQTLIAGEVTNLPHVSFKVTTRYNEWNENFDFSRT